MVYGQIAQLVEQGTENPRVGGSIPSLATTNHLLRSPSAHGALRLRLGPCWRSAYGALWPVVGALAFSLSLSAGCSLLEDRCERLCNQTGSALADCKDDTWVWEDVSASSKNNFVNACQERWQNVSADLGARDLELALADCKLAEQTLDELNCSELLPVYLEGDTDTDVSAN